MSFSIDAGFLAEANEKDAPALVEDYDHLARVLARRRLDAEAIAKKVAAFGVALPTWGVGTGGTRFARFPGAVARAAELGRACSFETARRAASSATSSTLRRSNISKPRLSASVS